MPIPIDEIEEEPAKFYDIEMDIVDFLDQNPKLAYTRKELFKKLGKKFETNNILMNAMANGLFAADLEIMVQKGYIKRGIGKNNKKYYFATKKNSISE